MVEHIRNVYYSLTAILGQVAVILVILDEIK